MINNGQFPPIKSVAYQVDSIFATGYNSISLSPPIFVSRKSMVRVTNHDGTIGWIKSSQITYTDVNWNVTGEVDKTALYLRLITNMVEIEPVRNYRPMKSYTKFGDYVISAFYQCDGVNYTSMGQLEVGKN